MIERIEGIVLDIVKHNDRHNVVTLYTRQLGRLAFLVPASATKAGRMRNAMLQLMAVVTADVNIKPGKELYTLRQAEPCRLWHSIYSNPLKTSLLFFLAEFSSRLVRQYPADERLWDFICSSLEILDSLPSRSVSNFHLAFLIRLLPIAGIEPDARVWHTGDRLDMATGEMVGEMLAAERPTLLSEDESRLASLLLRMNFHNMRLYRFTRDERNRVLSRLLSYYSMHFPISSDFRTLPVLRELFS